MRRIMEIIGAVMFILGVSSADSELLYVPICLVFTGLTILYAVERSEK